MDEASSVSKCRAVLKVGEMRDMGLCYRRGGLIMREMMRVVEAEVKEEVLRLSIYIPPVGGVRLGPSPSGYPSTLRAQSSSRLLDRVGTPGINVMHDR